MMKFQHTIHTKMANSIRFTILLLGSLALFSTSSHAQTNSFYLSDELTAPMHTGHSNQYRIKALLKSGTALTLIENNEETGYSKVVTARGTEGWIESKYLSSKPGAKLLLQRTLKELDSTKEKLANSQNAANTTSSDNQQLNQKINALSKRNKDLTSELASIKKISSNAMNLDRNNRELLKNNELLKIELAELQAENARLSDDSNKEWFLRGAFAVLIGVCITILAPRFKPRKKSSEWV